MRPILFHLFGHPVQAFGVMVALAFIAGLAWTLVEARRVGRDPQLFVDAFWRVALGGVLGARLLYVAVHPEELRGAGAWLGAFAVWRGGLVWYGGLIGGLAAGAWFVRRRRAPFLPALDLASPGIWLGLAVGRLGCYLVADDWGKPTDGAWGIAFPELEGSRLDPALFGVPLHPTQLYDALNAFAVFLLAAAILRRSDRPGRASGVGLALYAALRIVVEIFRGDDAARGIFTLPGLGLAASTSQWLSGAALIVGLAVAFRISGRGPAPASAAGD